MLLHSDTEVPSLGSSWLQVKSLAYTSVKGTVDGTYLAQHETLKLRQVPLSQYSPNNYSSFRSLLHYPSRLSLSSGPNLWCRISSIKNRIYGLRLWPSSRLRTISQKVCMIPHSEYRSKGCSWGVLWIQNDKGLGLGARVYRGYIRVYRDI